MLCQTIRNDEMCRNDEICRMCRKRRHTAEHCWKYNHDFDWEHKKVLHFENQEQSRRQSTQKKTSIISMEYPLNYQIFGNQ